MTHTPTPEAIEAAAVAVRKYYSAGGWVQTADVAKLAVEAAAPFIAAQAKAEALREAALGMDAKAENLRVVSQDRDARDFNTRTRYAAYA